MMNPSRKTLSEEQAEARRDSNRLYDLHKAAAEEARHAKCESRKAERRADNCPAWRRIKKSRLEKAAAKAVRESQRLTERAQRLERELQEAEQRLSAKIYLCTDWDRRHPAY